MTLSRLPSGQWRARIWVNGKDVTVASVLGLDKRTTWPTKTEARDAYDEARRQVRKGAGGFAQVSVAAFWKRWTTEPLYQRPKESTNIHNRERTKLFAERYGSLPMYGVNDAVVAEWLAGGNVGTIPALRAMFNDAMSAKAGRLIDRNPFAKLGISKGRGNRDVQPPSESTVRKLIVAAHQQAGPQFGAWLQVAAFTGMRPGELDALRWDCVDFDANRIHVAEQFSATSGTFTLPKNGKRRWAPLTPEAREVLIPLSEQRGEFCFVNHRGNHWTASSRAYHWKATRAAVGYTGSLYLATRHFAGWWMVNVLDQVSEDVAVALGHEDGGELVRILYGHRDKDRALDRIVTAYEDRRNVVPITTKRDVG